MFFRKHLPVASLLAIAACGCATTTQCETDCQSGSAPVQCRAAECVSTHQVAPLNSGVALANTYPLGSLTQAHHTVMQTNAEAADFCIPTSEFQAGSTELTEVGRDHVLELSSRMANTPFPILVEPDSDSSLNNRRRAMIARILADQGNQDAEHRTVLSTAYNPGMPAAGALRLVE